MLSAADIRQKYIDFFVMRGHSLVPSSPLVPPDDPTLLFTTAGMVQFKALYSGSTPLPYTCAVSVQKCLRAGGKGSDLENVGKTLRHHTFFEMLGNFSFGDYFKAEAIRWAWEFCTDPQWLGLPAERIFPTVYGKQRKDGTEDRDEPALTAWYGQTGIVIDIRLVNNVTLLDEKENFWGPAGETGACGMCSEIKFFTGTEEQLEFYHNLSYSKEPADHERLQRDIVDEGDLFLEIWNLVFPEFDRQLDGSRLRLKNRGIDTGAGLERITTAVQFCQSDGKVNSPYETDLLQPIVEKVSQCAGGLPYPFLSGGEWAEQELRNRGLDPAAVRLAMNACADHARALTFTLSEGIVPSNEGRGYVLRRILRRAARFGLKIGIAEPFLWRLVEPVVELMGAVYPEITQHVEMVQKTIRAEEERFTRALTQGGEILDQILAEIRPGEPLSGEQAYRLHDTFGYPLDLTIEATEEQGKTVDTAGFERCLAEGRSKARASWKGTAGAARWDELLKGLDDRGKTEFVGYDALECPAKVLAIIQGDRLVDRLEAGHGGVVVLDRTPCYAEAGGQIGDRGLLTEEAALGYTLTRQEKCLARLFAIEDTQKTNNGSYLHFGEAAEQLRVGQELVVRVDAERRASTRRNHSVTHLMQAALKELIGRHVTQQGSFVGPEGLRFDFTNPEPVGEALLGRIERRVNDHIRANLPVRTEVMDLEQARATGAIAPFGEKYGARVRVVSMGDVSQEFCGGTHVTASGDIGLFVITGESSVAAGIRRIEARAGTGALDTVNHERAIVQGLARSLSVSPEALEERVHALQEELKQLRRQAETARAEQARRQMAKAAEEFQEVAGLKLTHQRIDGANHQALAEAWDALRQQSPDRTVGLFYSVQGEKVNLVVGATSDVAPSRLLAGDVLKETAAIVGGKGGGKPTLARGGGTKPDKLNEALQAFPAIVENCAKKT